MVKVIEEMRKIANHHITSSELLDIIKGPFRKIDVTFMKVSTIGYRNIGCSIDSNPFVIELIQHKTVIMVDTAVNVSCITNIPSFYSRSLCFIEFNCLDLIMNKRIEAMRGHFMWIWDIEFLSPYIGTQIKMRIGLLASFNRILRIQPIVWCHKIS